MQQQSLVEKLIDPRNRFGCNVRLLEGEALIWLIFCTVQICGLSHSSNNEKIGWHRWHSSTLSISEWETKQSWLEGINKSGKRNLETESFAGLDICYGRTISVYDNKHY